MPILPKRPCPVPGCPVLGPCPTHRRPVLPLPAQAAQPVRLYDDRRGSSTQRGYDRQWRKMREEYFKRNPFCSHCRKLLGMKKVLDHRIAKAQGGTDHDANLQGLCVRCHNRKTGMERRLKLVGKGVGGVKSLQVFTVDRSSYLTVCRREIGKEKVASLLGNLNDYCKVCSLR